MKTITLLSFLCCFGIAVVAQDEKPEPKKSEDTETIKEEDNSKQELHGEKKEESVSETKSFTLDANDAVLEETSKDLEDEIERPEVPESTTYHYNHHHSQDDIQTLAGKNSHHGGFGGITFKSSEFNNQDIIMAGFRGGWIINRALAIGFEGHGIIPTAEFENIDPDNNIRSRAVGGYGGMFLEPIILSNKVVHVTFPVSGGAGWLGYIVDWEQHQHYSEDLIDDDVFWFVEPGAALELNVARNFRINMGAAYRFTKDLEMMSTPSTAFDGWNYFLTLKFGSF